MDKRQLKLFTNFLSIPFDYLVISRVTLGKIKEQLVTHDVTKEINVHDALIIY